MLQREKEKAFSSSGFSLPTLPSLTFLVHFLYVRRELLNRQPWHRCQAGPSQDQGPPGTGTGPRPLCPGRTPRTLKRHRRTCACSTLYKSFHVGPGENLRAEVVAVSPPRTPSPLEQLPSGARGPHARVVLWGSWRLAPEVRRGFP